MVKQSAKQIIQKQEHIVAEKEISNILQEGIEVNKKKKMEILSLMKESRASHGLNNNQKEIESIICPLFCSTRLTVETYTDHLIQCETNIQACKKCGDKYNKNQIHREITKHSKAKQRFACMECMQARKVRLNLIQYHKNICLGSHKEKIKENNTEEQQDMVDKTPQFMGKELQTLYDRDIRIKNY